MTVDGDRSTNDTCLLVATGRAGNAARRRRPRPRFAQAVEAVMLDLAQQLVRDGEGATKFVRGAGHRRGVRRLRRARSPAPSAKARWSRPPSPARTPTGAASPWPWAAPTSRWTATRLSIRFGDLWAARDGAVSPDYDEAAMSAYMKTPELAIAVDVGVGSGSATMWTCDLTHGYISINGDYRS